MSCSSSRSTATRRETIRFRWFATTTTCTPSVGLLTDRRLSVVRRDVSNWSRLAIGARPLMEYAKSLFDMAVFLMASGARPSKPLIRSQTKKDPSASLTRRGSISMGSVASRISRPRVRHLDLTQWTIMISTGDGWSLWTSLPDWELGQLPSVPQSLLIRGAGVGIS